MAFLVVVGALQFVYCLLVGNFVSATQSREEGRKRREKGKRKLISKNANGCVIAFQCISVGLFGDRGAVCFDWYVLQSDGRYHLTDERYSFPSDTNQC